MTDEKIFLVNDVIYETLKDEILSHTSEGSNDWEQIKKGFIPITKEEIELLIYGIKKLIKTFNTTDKFIPCNYEDLENLLKKLEVLSKS